MMEAVRASEMEANFSVTTRRYIPEDSKQLFWTESCLLNCYITEQSDQSWSILTQS
jgi:hypothetical protein